ncbi:MAG: glycosyl hydrolase 108 family protein [Gammaproteobacteria bacterium]|nr:glycosyl hydrolase 108 family protein [Gammaproteobacteria bacterium]
MSNFDTAILTVLRHEGLYVNDPQDAGGATNYGVSLRWLKSIGDLNSDGFLDGDLDHDGDVDLFDVKNMTRDDAIKLYRQYWWDNFPYEKIVNQLIGTKLFDLAVNMGSKPSHKCLQRAIRAASGLHLLEDGILGTKSLEAINAANADTLLAAYRSEAAGFYRSLNKPKYIEGWLNRAYS